MASLIRQLWQDDSGAVVVSDLALVASVLVLGSTLGVAIIHHTGAEGAPKSEGARKPSAPHSVPGFRATPERP
jgi:hypothetical protein